MIYHVLYYGSKWEFGFAVLDMSFILFSALMLIFFREYNLWLSTDPTI
jgi:hypothetical protein